MTTTCASAVKRRPSWESGRCRMPTPLTWSEMSARRMPRNQSRLARRACKARIAYDSTVYIRSAIRQTSQRPLSETLLIVDYRDLPLHGIAAHGDHPGCRHSDLAGRRGLPDDAGGLYHQSSHARWRSFCAVGLVVDDADRGGGKCRTPPAGGREPAGGCVQGG